MLLNKREIKLLKTNCKEDSIFKRIVYFYWSNFVLFIYFLSQIK